MNPEDSARVLQALVREYISPDIDLLPGILAKVEERNRSKMKLGTKLLIAFGVVVLVMAVVLISVPAAANAMRGLFGYIPGVGIVEREAPIRVLAGPASITRDGITVEVTAATLTGDRTHIEYRTFGVPQSAMPDRENVIGCTTLPYLRLPDGTQISHTNNDYGPVPAGINEAVFVMPCIPFTLPGTEPTGWELPLKFVVAPRDFYVGPVIDRSPSPQPSEVTQPAPPPGTSSTTPTVEVARSLTVIKEIETQDGYILVGGLSPQVRREGLASGEMEIKDATGKKVAYTQPENLGLNALGLDPNEFYWEAQFKAAGLTYPLTVSFSGVSLQQADPQATAEFSFDAGPDPQAGQEWMPDEEIELAGHTLKLLSIGVGSRGGYSFEFQGDPQVYSADVQIKGYTPTGGGGGWGGPKGSFTRSVTFVQIPTGVLTVTLSNLTITGDALTWEGQWSPATPRTDLPANPTPQPGLCLAAGTLGQLSPAASEWPGGKALVYEQVVDGAPWGLAVYNLEGGQRQGITTNGNWGALSPDGNEVAYSASDNGIHIIDLATGTDRTLENATGFDLHWSPDGKQIAYVGSGANSAGIFVVGVDGAGGRHVASSDHAAVAGWAPDGAALYFAVPYTGAAAWKIYVLDLASGASQELFTIENGTAKLLNPALSPDGRWIAYRGRDNSSLYLVRTDGSGMHVVMDDSRVAGIAWTRSGWLGASLREPGSNLSKVVLLKPDTCEAYRAPIAPHGDLEGLFIP
jgi:hypothetical protein